MGDASAAITVDRETLYREVWSIPGSKLAKKYGISDVALAKACRRHKIPRPPRGHWAKLAHSKRVKQTPLPSINDRWLKEVRFYPSASGVRSFRDPELAAKDAAVAVPSVMVPERLSSPHPLIVSTRDQLDKQTRRRGHKASDRERVLDVKVSQESMPRALRIMDTTLKAWESIGGSVAVEQDSRGGHSEWRTYIRIGEDRIPVTLEESRRRVDGSSRLRPEWRYTGRLSLRVDSWRSQNLRRTWADGKRQRLEDVLESAVSGLLMHIDATKQRRLDHEIENRQARKAEATRTKAERRGKEEQERREAITEAVRRWRLACHIREYLAAIETALAQRQLRRANEEAFAKWFRWARWYADHLDPLTEPEPIPEMEPKRPTNLPLSELELTSHTRPILECLGVQNADELYKVSRHTIRQAERDRPSLAWREIYRVLEGLGYDVSDRSCWSW